MQAIIDEAGIEGGEFDGVIVDLENISIKEGKMCKWKGNQDTKLGK